MSLDDDLVEAARADLKDALKRCAEVVREADPSLGIEEIKARHKQFDELWPVVIQTVRRVHGCEPTYWALIRMGRKEDTEFLKEAKRASSASSFDKTPP